MFLHLVTILAGIVPPADAGSAPASLIRNGGFEQASGWTVSNGEIADGGSPGRCLHIAGPGGASQDVLVARRQMTLTAAVDVLANSVQPQVGKPGYAFAAVYQTDETGRLVASHDFAQLTGTQAWQRYSHAFRVHPEADYVSLRCGLFQADGETRFDNWTLVPGSEARRLDEVAEPSRGPPHPGAAAILNAPDLPVRGAASSPAVIAAVLREAGLETQLLSADELADPTVLSASRFNLLVLPTGQSFPAAARLATIEFLRRGGSFLSLGGYTFNHLVRKVDTRWVDEQQRVQAQLDEAMRRDRSLLADGDFEQETPPPIGGSALDARWRRGSERCRIIADGAYEGRQCAEVAAPPGTPPDDVFWAELPCQAGKTYQISGWMRTRDVTGAGMAYMAVYQYDAEGQYVEFRDFATARGTTDWQLFKHAFTPHVRAVRLRIPIGLYQANGTAWFDDVRLGDITSIGYRPMNTATGKPGDGLEVGPAQIGVFDASFPLQRARTIRTAPGQFVVPRPIELAGDFQGWAASGVIGYDQARWIPLLDTFDRYGRPRGAAAALVVNYQGFYSGSCWACFGVENVDLFADPKSPLLHTLQEVARFVVRKTFLRNLTTNHRLVREGEPVVASVTVNNRGSQPQQGEVAFSLESAPERTAKFTLAAEASQRIEVTFNPQRAGVDLWQLTAELRIDGQPIDQLVSGFVVEQPAIMQSAPKLRFADNYFTLDGRPLFLFGSDTYDSIYRSASENPLTWSAELAAARDLGMNLYENLQYNRPGHVLDDDDWRSFRALAQLTQKHRLVFMPGMLIGHNVAVGDKELAEQSALCRQYAQRLSDVPALLYYVNGDYQLNAAEHPQDVQTLWNRWIAERHGTLDRLRAAWGADAVRGEWCQIGFPPLNSGRWDDVAALDKSRFENWQMLRWNHAHVQAVRELDRDHPITSEYYSHPTGGIDLVNSIDGLDVSNIGFFDRPIEDLDNLPLRLHWNDLRLRGKGVSLGEYGVKTHPAWAVSNGGSHYHIQRSEEEQRQLFVMIAHYALGFGASKVQNWCLRDAQAWVFPWGIFYPNQLIPKDVAYVHRNQSLVWRHFAPVYRPPALAVCLANQLRLGNQATLGTTVAERTFADLLAVHCDFGVIDDDHLQVLPSAVTAMILPAPFAMRDESYQRLLAWVRGGGTLLVTGDFSYDPGRRRAATARLGELAGVEFLTENYPNVQRHAGRDVIADLSPFGLGSHVLRPGVQVKPISAEVLGQSADGQPVLLRNTVGRGSVYYLTDPVELDDAEPTKTLRRGLYAAFLRAARVQPLPVEPDAPWLHVMAQPTSNGTVHVVVNTKTAPGTEVVQIPTAAGLVRLTTRNRWPAMAAATSDGKLVAVGAYGNASLGGDRLFAGSGLKLLLSLDGKDLRQAAAFLIAPLEPGRVELPARTGALIAVLGEFQEGVWKTLERVPLDGQNSVLDIDADRATCLILVCPPGEEERWTTHLTNALRWPAYG